MPNRSTGQITLKGTRNAIKRVRKALDKRMADATEMVQNRQVSLEGPGRGEFLEQLEIHKELVKKGSEDLEVHLRDFEECMEDADDAEAIEAEHDALTNVSNRCVELVTQMQTILNIAKAHPVTAQVQSLQSPAPVSLMSPAQSGQSSGELPRLQIPRFDGDILNWKTFWDQFEKIHNRVNLPAVDKFNYLIQGLQDGEAYQCIRSIPMTNDTYQKAVDILKDRYGKPETVVASLYRKFNSLRVTAESPEGLRTFCDEIDCLLNTLEALGRGVDGDYLVSTVQAKLPGNLILALEMQKPVSQKWTLATLRQTLSDHIDRIETSARVSMDHSVGNNRVTDRVYTADALLAPSGTTHKHKPKPKKKVNYQSHAGGGAHNSGFSKQKTCAFCGGNHFPERCEKFRTADSRYRQLNGRCSVCLSDSHKKFQCRVPQVCYYCKKSKNHHSALCWAKFGHKAEQAHIATELQDAADTDAAQDVLRYNGDVDRVLDPGNNKNDIPTCGDTCQLAFDERVVLQTAMTTLCNPSQPQVKSEVRVLLDCASSRSFITEKEAKRLQLVVRKEEDIILNRFGTNAQMRIPARSTKLTMSLKNGSVMQLDLNVVPHITGDLCRSKVPLHVVKRIGTKLQLADSLPLIDEQNPIEVLLGNDYYLDIVTGEKLEVQPGLYLLGSHVGWILSGRIPINSKKLPEMSVCCHTAGSVSTVQEIHGNGTVEPHIVPNMEDLWSMEKIGIHDEPLQADDVKALEQFEATVQYDGTRYAVTLPWREGAETALPDNYDISLRRFETLVRRFQDDDLFSKYAAIFTDQLAKGVIERVTSETQTRPICHYLPHHAVVSPQKATTKVRVVFDGSARADRHSPSLNDSLLRGPVMLEDICHILLRFRLKKITLISDIEKAFLQVGVQVCDRDKLRFLWLIDPSKPTLKDNLGIFRFARVPFGAICSPFLLAATMHHHFAKYDTECAKLMLNNHYVDNIITGVSTVQDAKEYYVESKKVCREAGLNLREWSSNSQEFLESVPEIDRAKDVVQKVLGVCYDTLADTISISGPVESIQPIETKRQFLSAMSSFFDPMGLMSPCMVKAKVHMQQLSKMKLKWDEKVCGDVKKALLECFDEMTRIPKCSIPRYIPNQDESKLQLHCFTDASNAAYAAAIYLRVNTADDVRAELAFAKTRLNPLKKMTIPRLELMGVLIGVRLLSFVRQALGLTIETCFLWCDSQIALSWVCSEKKLETWTRNRVSEIRKFEDLKLRYVESENNPADLATRGKAANELDDLWWHGPSWLAKSSNNWPQQAYLFPSVVNDEVFAEFSVHAADCSEVKMPFGLDPSRFETKRKLLHVTAICQLFITKASKREQSTWSKVHKAHGKCYLLIDPSDMEKAEETWIKAIQRRHYDNPSKCLQNEMRKLGVHVNERGILVCCGRLEHAKLPLAIKYPILLHKSDPFTSLLIRDIHFVFGHAGWSHTLSTLRWKYWIPAVGPQILSMIRKCCLCQKLLSKPYMIPPMPELPKSRVQKQIPFAYTGVDFFGPLRVSSKSSYNIQKVWIALFTCLTIRAVHLEVVLDCSAVEFLLALRRFIARRGRPLQILSDNATQFKAVDDFVSSMWLRVVEDPEVRSFCCGEGIRWSYITAYAPWMGGVYERMVGIVKAPLRKVLGRSVLNVRQLETVLCEIEAIVNSRPLTSVNEDIENLTILTPNHFLMKEPTCMQGIQSVEDVVKTVTQKNLVEMWKKGDNLLNEFWSIWLKDYLNSLRQRNTYHHKKVRSSPITPAVGHLVVIKDEKLARGSWRIGRIVELLQGSDGVVRSAMVKVPSGRVVRRPIALLCPFETTEETDSKEGETTGETDNKEGEMKTDTYNQSDTNQEPGNKTADSGAAADGDPTVDASRPKRRAATEARQRWQGLMVPNPIVGLLAAGSVVGAD